MQRNGAGKNTENKKDEQEKDGKKQVQEVHHHFEIVTFSLVARYAFLWLLII